MNSDDQHRRQADAAALLRKPAWSDEEIDHAVALHDVLESPRTPADPVAAMLRRRLAPAVAQRYGRSGQVTDLVRAETFSAGWLDSPNPLERHLCLLTYLGYASFAGFEAGAFGQLDRAISMLGEFEDAVREEGPAAHALLRERYDTALITLAAACLTRYDSRRELLLLPGTTAEEGDAIRADLSRALDVGTQVSQLRDSSSRAAALTIMGSCYARLYEDDQRHGSPATIDSAIACLQDALRLAGTAADSGAAAARAGIMDRLAGALLVRNHRADVDAAIDLYSRVRAQAAALPVYNAAGGALSMATARLMRWSHTRSPADERAARSAYRDGFASAVTAHPPTAVDIATQWGGWAWTEGWLAEAGVAYGQAIRVLHQAVRQQASRADRELVLRKVPGVAAMAALCLARDGAADAALVALETGRAVLLAQAFEQRSLDYSRIAAVAGQQNADHYQLLTAKMTRLEALLLAASPPGGRQAAADLEAVRQERSAFANSLGTGLATALSNLEQPPTFAELLRTAGPAPVVSLAATPNGGLALILRAGEQEPLEAVDLPQLTTAKAAGMVAALQHAQDAGDTSECDQVCEALWTLAMHRILPRLGDAAHAVFIPGGPLSALPWHAAADPDTPGRNALDQLAVSYMPNIRSLSRARMAWDSAAQQLRALAISQPMPTRTPLRATEAELEAVCSYDSDGFRVTRLPGAEATVGALLGAISEFEVLHFAGHAIAVPDDPLSSAMSMAGDQPLTVRDLLVRGPGSTLLAILSACETARAQDPLSDEIVSFPTALLQCGLGGVLGSLWKSRDRPTSRFIRIFYREWQSHHLPPHEALRVSQQWTRDHHMAPSLTWANFIYVGP